MRGCRRRCVDARAAQCCGSGAPTWVHFSPRKHNAEEVRIKLIYSTPATRRVYTSWHGATQTHFPARPRKSAWHCDITDVIRHAVCPHTRSNPITRYRQLSCSPATGHVYTSMFRAPQWHGATQTHFPPIARPRKSAWHCDITNVISPHVLPHTTSNHITRCRPSSRSPATRCVYTSMFRAPQ